MGRCFQPLSMWLTEGLREGGEEERELRGDDGEGCLENGVFLG